MTLLHALLRRLPPPNRTIIVSFLLPHSHPLDHHLTFALLFPSRQPLFSSIPKVLPRRVTSINPRLPTCTVLEPAIRTANSNIDDEIEVLVERRRSLTRLTPRVEQASAILTAERKVATRPQRCVEVRVQYLQEAGVNVCENVLLTPLQAESVIACCVGGMKCIALHIRPPPSVVCRVGTPVQCG